MTARRSPQPRTPSGSTTDSEGFPLGLRVALDAGVRWIDDGTLVGGSPTRLLRLSASGRALVRDLAAGEPVPPSPAAQDLVRRLLDGGLAHPRPPAAPTPPAVAVVIPVRDDAEGLSATLAALARAGATNGPPPVTVVDDASAEGQGLGAACATGGAALHSQVTLHRQATWSGPAAARNVGWRATAEPLVAFVDANCEPEPGWLDRLLPHFADPRVAAVAPRITPAAAPEAPRWLAAYETVASPLDLGGREAIVRPRSPVAYVPTAALVVRRAALEAVGGFDESLRVGEDVDFVWRLVAAGWTVRYEPRAAVRHPVRPGWRAWMAQRYRYGTSAAPLARRHGAAVAPAVVSPWTAAAWGLAAVGHPALAAAAAGWPAAALAGGRPHPGAGRRSPGDRLPVGKAVRLAATGHLRGGLALGRGVRRAWAPVALLLAVSCPGSRPALAAAVVGPGVADWLDRRPGFDPARFVALRLADDLAYCAGLWAGCVRGRSARALLPDVAVRRPSRWARLSTHPPLDRRSIQ